MRFRWALWYEKLTVGMRSFFNGDAGWPVRLPLASLSFPFTSLLHNVPQSNFWAKHWS